MTQAEYIRALEQDYAILLCVVHRAALQDLSPALQQRAKDAIAQTQTMMSILERRVRAA